MKTPLLRASAAAAAGIVVMLSLAACSAPSSAAGSWGETGDAQPQLVLDEGGQLSGTDGCNRLTGSWEQNGDTIVFGPVGSTMMACPDVDTWLLGLATAQVTGEQLVILDATGAEIGTLSKTIN